LTRCEWFSHSCVWFSHITYWTTLLQYIHKPKRHMLADGWLKKKFACCMNTQILHAARHKASKVNIIQFENWSNGPKSYLYGYQTLTELFLKWLPFFLKNLLDIRLHQKGDEPEKKPWTRSIDAKFSVISDVVKKLTFFSVFCPRITTNWRHVIKLLAKESKTKNTISNKQIQFLIYADASNIVNGNQTLIYISDLALEKEHQMEISKFKS
jgi:hypothetical protein